MPAKVWLLGKIWAHFLILWIRNVEDNITFSKSIVYYHAVDRTFKKPQEGKRHSGSIKSCISRWSDLTKHLVFISQHVWRCQEWRPRQCKACWFHSGSSPGSCTASSEHRWRPPWNDPSRKEFGSEIWLRSQEVSLRLKLLSQGLSHRLWGLLALAYCLEWETGSYWQKAVAIWVC